MTGRLSPADVARAFEGVCPYCGKGPYKSLASHVNLGHGMDHRAFKDELGVTYDTPLCSPEYSEQQREKATKPEVAERLRAASKGAARRKRQLSDAAKRERSERGRAWAQSGRTDDPNHGTRLKYERDGCRCDKCKAFNTGRWRDYMSARTGQEIQPQQPTAHGTRRMYENKGCRCDTCRAANTERSRRYWERRRQREG